MAEQGSEKGKPEVVEGHLVEIKDLLSSLLERLTDGRRGDRREARRPAVTFTDGRVTFTGDCDFRNVWTINKTNGAQRTIRWPKNAGNCKMVILTLDADGNQVVGSVKDLDPGDVLESYTAAAGGQYTVFSCQRPGDSCILEVDR